MAKSFNTHPVLQAASEGMNFIVMAGLTLASAAALAVGPGSRPAPAEAIVLPTVEVTAQATPRLPTVIVTAKRSAG